MPSSPPIPSSSASAIYVKTGSGINSKNAQSAFVELQGELDLFDLDYKEFAAITTKPTSTLASPRRVNIFPVDTSGGDVSLASLATPATLGVAAGDRLIFRKSTTDANVVTFPATLYGQSVTIRLSSHYSESFAQIDLLAIDSTNYILVNH